MAPTPKTSQAGVSSDLGVAAGRQRASQRESQQASLAEAERDEEITSEGLVDESDDTMESLATGYVSPPGPEEDWLPQHVMPPPQDEHVPHEEEEVPYMRIHRIRASFMEVFLPDDEVYQVQVVPGCDDLHERTLRTLVKSILRNFRFDQHILFLDGFKASPDDVIIIEEDRTERAVSQVRILRRGLRGGGYEDPRSAIQQILMAKGLAAPEARDKCDEVLSKVPKDSLEAWLPKANWQSLKTLVSNKVTFMPKHKQGKDPLTEKDPWMEALQDRHKSSSSKDHPKPFLNPDIHVHLIPQVWTNEDGSNPQILERVQHGSTGLALLSHCRLAPYVRYTVNAHSHNGEVSGSRAHHNNEYDIACGPALPVWIQKCKFKGGPKPNGIPHEKLCVSYGGSLPRICRRASLATVHGGHYGICPSHH